VLFACATQQSDRRCRRRGRLPLSRTGREYLERIGAQFRGPGPFTIFAPTDAAFDKLPAAQLENLFKPENKDELISLVNYHVIKGSKMAADIGKWETAKMINGQSQPVKLADGKISIGGAHVIAADITTSNGVMHGIDKVNVPTSTKH